MSTVILQRTAFETSRLLEFFTQKEMARQIGQELLLWSVMLVLVKTIERDIAPSRVKTQKVESEVEGLPFVLEVTFGFLDHHESKCTQVVGLNRASAVIPPLVEMHKPLGKTHLDFDDPIIIVMHLACPHLAFTDRSKAALALSGPTQAAPTQYTERGTKLCATEKQPEFVEDQAQIARLRYCALRSAPWCLNLTNNRVFKRT